MVMAGPSRSWPERRASSTTPSWRRLTNDWELNLGGTASARRTYSLRERSVDRPFGALLATARVWKRHHRFSMGTWDIVLSACRAEADAKAEVEALPLLDGRPVDMVLSAWQTEADAKAEIDGRLSVDSTVARVHQHGATAARSRLTPTSPTGCSVELQGESGAGSRAWLR